MLRAKEEEVNSLEPAVARLDELEDQLESMTDHDRKVTAESQVSVHVWPLSELGSMWSSCYIRGWMAIVKYCDSLMHMESGVDQPRGDICQRIIHSVSLQDWTKSIQVNFLLSRCPSDEVLQIFLHMYTIGMADTQ